MDNQNLNPNGSSQQPNQNQQAGENAPGAMASMICGIIGIFCVGIILGIVAIVQGNKALGFIRQNPGKYKGKGMAIAGISLGIFEIVVTVIAIIVRIVIAVNN